MAIGSAVSAIVGNKAASKAGKAQVEAAQLAVNAQRDMYGQNKQMLTPYMGTGNAAMSNINALLGIAPQAAPSMGGTGGVADWNAYLQNNPDVLQGFYQQNRFATPEEYAQFHWGTYGANEGRTSPFTATTGAAGQGAVTQPTAQQAFDTFRNSTGYQFRLNQGMDAINSGYAGAGTIKSGAAMKGINDYGQGMASQEFGNYLNALGNQQALGFSGASALAGVGQNFANNVGNLYQQQGEARANTALTKAQNVSGAIQNAQNNAMKIFGAM